MAIVPNRAGVGGDRDGGQTGDTVVGHGAGERIHVHAKVRVTADQAYAVPANASDHRCAGKRAVALVAHVDGGTLRMARRLTRRDEGIDAGRRATTGEKPTRTLRIAEPAPKPVDDDQLDLARAARYQPGALVDVVAGGHEVGQHTGPGG